MKFAREDLHPIFGKQRAFWLDENFLSRSETFTP
jgi:hypothetical protein